MSAQRCIGWMGIVRLGLVQTSLGAIVVLTTSTLNRVMVVELALPAMLPGVLVAIHYFVQLSRPRFGYGSDNGKRRTPWIVGGISALGVGGVLAAIATAIMATSTALGVTLAVIAFTLIGAGVGASGTCLLVLLASHVEPRRRAAAASITWIMMIAGFAITAGIAGAFLDPFSFTRLVVISAVVAVLAFVTTALALRNLEGSIAPSPAAPIKPSNGEQPSPTFREALADVAGEQHTRRFALFVFISMLAYSAQDLILEPFAGVVFGLTPGQSTQLGGSQHTGVLIGMLIVAFVGYRLASRRQGILRICMIAGCVGSALLMLVLAAAGFLHPEWPLHSTVLLLGIANGVFAVAAIGSMMSLVSKGHRQRDGVRMGVWGAAQAIAFGIGGVLGTLAVDLIRYLSGSALYAYSLVFVAQAVLFAVAAFLAADLSRRSLSTPSPSARALGAEAGQTSQRELPNAAL
jgi:BCD family chlorophyll transporter-like MFS transporter